MASEVNFIQEPRPCKFLYWKIISIKIFSRISFITADKFAFPKNVSDWQPFT